MKTKTLIKMLQEQGEDKEVFFSNDEEGNIIYNACDVDFDGKKLIIYPWGEEFKKK